MTPDEFDAVDLEYSQKQHGVVLDMAVRHLPAGCTVLDLGCATGLRAAALWHDGFNVMLLDSNVSYLRRAIQRCGGARGFVGDMLTSALPRTKAALLTNVTGYFTLQENDDLLGRIPARFLLANYMLMEDQSKDVTCTPTKDGASYEFPLLKGDSITLEALRGIELFAAIRKQGWRIVEERTYTDFKTERMLMLERL